MKPLVLLAGVLGLLFLVASVIYFITPANSLPGFFPGHDATITKIHYKHGIGTLLLGVGCFVFAWFQSGKKSPKSDQ